MSVIHSHRNCPWPRNPLLNFFKPCSFVRSLPLRKGGYSLLEGHECKLFRHQRIGTVSVYYYHSTTFLPKTACQFQTSFTETLWVTSSHIFKPCWFMKRVLLSVTGPHGCQVWVSGLIRNTLLCFLSWTL